MVNRGVKTIVSESSVSQHTHPSQDKANLDPYLILHVKINHKQFYLYKGKAQDEENSDFSSLQQSRVYGLLLAIKRVQRGFQGLLMAHPRSRSHGVSVSLKISVRTVNGSDTMDHVGKELNTENLYHYSNPCQ